MNIAVIGAGEMGLAIGALCANKGYCVGFSNSRGAESLTEIVSTMGPNALALPVEENIVIAEIVILTLPWRRTEALPSKEKLRGKIVIDAMNPYDENKNVLQLSPSTSSEETAKRLPEARIVKAFNTIWSKSLTHFSNSLLPLDKRIALYLSGDDEAAKMVVSNLIDELGFAPMDLGSLKFGGRRQQPGTPLYGTDLTKTQAEYLLTHAFESGLLPCS